MKRITEQQAQELANLLGVTVTQDEYSTTLHEYTPAYGEQFGPKINFGWRSMQDFRYASFECNLVSLNPVLRIDSERPYQNQIWTPKAT